jgi:hypothetical protein
VSAALQIALPEEGLDLRAELVEYQGWMVAQALDRSRGDLAAAAKLLGLTPLELTRVNPTRPENPDMKQPPAVSAVPTPPKPTLVTGALPALPEKPLSPEELGRVDKGLLKIDTAVIKRLDAEGQSFQQIAARLGVNRYFVERVLRMLAEPSVMQPLAKCGEKREP